MIDVQGDFRSRMKTFGVKWLQDRDIQITQGQQLFTVAGAVPILESLQDGELYADTDLASCQSCLRMNTWDGIGYSDKYHIYFQMLGHFSLYRVSASEAKEWAITTALSFLEDDLGLSKERLRVSVHPDDLFTSQLWQKLGFSSEHISYESHKHDATFITKKSGYRTKIGWLRRDGSVMRFWDIVFVQFADTDYSKPLERILVDSGMSVDRLLTAAEDTGSSYKTSIWSPFLFSLSEACEGALKSPELQRLGDVCRAASILLIAGVEPSAKRHGYVIRKLLRECFRILVIANQIDKCLGAIAIGLRDGVELYPAHLHKATEQSCLSIASAEIERFKDTLGRALKKSRLLKQRSGGVLSEEDKILLRNSFGMPNELLPKD